MKYLSFIFLIVLFCACNRSQTGDIEISGTAKNATYGSIVIKDIVKNMIFKADIKDNKFAIKGYLQYSGYYRMIFSTPATKGITREVELYLEPGNYTINIDPAFINDYPAVTSTSEVQKQLSQYYAINDTMRHESRRKVIAINNQMKTGGDEIKDGDNIEEIARLQEEEIKASRVDPLSVFNAFMNKYPDNVVASHIMIGMDYQNDPASYQKLYQKFSAGAKATEDGKTLEQKLKQLSGLAPGSPMPKIEGSTPTGEKLDIKAMHKKLLLIDFWRSTNGTSRDNHKRIIGQLMQLSTKGFGVISVSLDTVRAKWTAAIDKDKMKWTQISDLKGDESLNGVNWGIKSIPAYYLIDGEGRIIKRVSEFNDLPAEVEDFFKAE
ncbi:redoxin family protein [Mucilaginibacter antarcticus]|uniref:Redoxin family protein n=1 Tax=Mucilaginibacter antarcticus TaxID=1855725 RepID=A0ABW5XMW2_9SPHI